MTVKIYKFIDKYLIPIINLLVWPLKAKKSKPKKLESIAIIRLYALGESLLTLPMIKRIKDRHPSAKITVICSHRNKIIFENLDFIDSITTIDPSIIRLFKKFDVAIDTEPFMNMGTLLSFWVGKKQLGFPQKGSSFLYSHRIKFNDKIHSADNFIKLAEPLKIENSKLEKLTSLNPGKEPNKWAKNIAKSLKKPLIGLCITTGPTGLSRLWPIKKWVKLSKQLIKKHKPTIVIIGSPEEKVYIKRFQKLLNYPKTINTTDTGLKNSIALISKLNLLISSDTGPMHIGAAQNTPTIGLFCPNTPTRFKPLGKKNSHIYKPVMSKPCINVHLGEVPDCKNHPHMENINPKDILEEINKLNKKWRIL